MSRLPWNMKPVPPHVQAERQSIEFWFYTLPARTGAVLERLAVDNEIACAVLQDDIKVLADRARRRIDLWPQVELADMLSGMEQHNRVLVRIGRDATEFNKAMQDLGLQLQQFGREDGALDFGG